MLARSEYHLFLCHNNREKLAVRKVAKSLSNVGLNIWFDDWQLRPGDPWCNKLEHAIRTSKAAAVFVGKDGVGPWQSKEIRACLSESAERGMQVIPVLLPGAAETERLPIFLQDYQVVDLRNGVSDEEVWQLACSVTCEPSSMSQSRRKSKVARDWTMAAKDFPACVFGAEFRTLHQSRYSFSHVCPFCSCYCCSTTSAHSKAHRSQTLNFLSSR